MQRAAFFNEEQQPNQGKGLLGAKHTAGEMGAERRGHSPDMHDHHTHARPATGPSDKKALRFLFIYSKETSGTRYTKGSDLRRSL